jgi:phage terminase Nu1 subunit (DNA packaging protein)
LALSSETPPATAAVRVNKRELARILSVSLPTVSAWLDRYPDFPTLQVGRNGLEYQFDPIAVRAFMAAKEEAEEAEEAARTAAIAQLGLSLETPAAALADALSPRERLDHVRAIQAEDELRVKRGYLVSVPTVRQAMTAAVARWNRMNRAALRQAGHDMALPDAVVRALQDRLGETQAQFIRELGYEAGIADAAA